MTYSKCILNLTYSKFTFDTEEADKTVNEILNHFYNFAVGEINKTYERLIFDKKNQKLKVSFECSLTVIRALIRNCNYYDDM